VVKAAGDRPVLSLTISRAISGGGGTWCRCGRFGLGGRRNEGAVTFSSTLGSDFSQTLCAFKQTLCSVSAATLAASGATVPSRVMTRGSSATVEKKFRLGSLPIGMPHGLTTCSLEEPTLDQLLRPSVPHLYPWALGRVGYNTELIVDFMDIFPSRRVSGMTKPSSHKLRNHVYCFGFFLSH
jgi:hypothetical protein